MSAYVSGHVFDWRSYECLSKCLYGDIRPANQTVTDGRRTGYRIQMPVELADGHIELVFLSEQASLLIFDCVWKETTEFQVGDGDRVRLNFSLELDMTLDFQRSSEFDANMPSWRFINNTGQGTVLERSQKGTRSVWVTLAFEPRYLETIMGRSVALDTDNARELFETPVRQPIYRDFPLDHRLNQITGNIIASDLADPFHLAYLDSKATELICVALDHMLYPEIQAQLPVVLRERDEKAIRLARDIILENLADPPSLRELCLMIGINRNKLHYGFKHLYKMPISKYLQDQKLREAYRQLQQTDQPLVQVAMNVGFAHQSSFSTAFKNRFGFPPNKLRDERR